MPLRRINLFGYPPIHLLLYGFGAALLHVLIERIGIDMRLAPLLVIALSVPLSFVLTRAWLARGTRTASSIPG